MKYEYFDRSSHTWNRRDDDSLIAVRVDVDAEVFGVDALQNFRALFLHLCTKNILYICFGYMQTVQVNGQSTKTLQ